MRSKTLSRWLRKRKYGYEHVPRQLSIALTNRCNARCIYCGINEKNLSGDMTIEKYKEIIDAVPFVEEVQPQIVGEPFLYPKLIEAIEYAKEAGKKVVIYTNGSIFTPELARDMFKAGLDRLIFSIDDNNKEGFEALRIGLSWERVLKNVRNFRVIRDTDDFKTRLSVRICITNKNRDRIKEIRRFWWNYADNVAAMPVIDVIAGKTRYVKKLKSGIICSLLEDSISIDANGKLLMCCRDWYGECEPLLGGLDICEDYYGKISSKCILDLYNSGQMNLLRKKLKEGVLVPELCYSCTYPYENVKW